MLRELRNLFALLTTLPVGMNADCLNDSARLMYLFPAVGAFIGLLGGLFAYSLLHVFPAFVSGFLTLGFILLITGVHHTDGLLDFGDGVMCQGSAERKLRAMRDQNMGAGGLSLGLVVMMTSASCIASIGLNGVLQTLIVSEVVAKFAIVTLASTGRSAREGMNTPFVEAMRGRHGMVRLLVALTITIAVAFLISGLLGLLMMGIGVLTSLVVAWVSRRHFGGVTGDVFGASNDLARMTSLLLAVAMFR